MKYSRNDYMNHKCTHREYYAQFVTDDIKDIVKRRIGIKALLASKDEYLNDISLKQWDNIHLQSLVQSQLKEAGDGFSLAGNVCILKEAAHQLIEENKVS